MEIKSSFIENEIREMTPKDPYSLKESYLEFYEFVPSRENGAYANFYEIKEAFSCFFGYITDLVLDMSEESRDRVNLNALMSHLQQSKHPYAKKTFSYVQEMEEIRRQAKAHPQDKKATENYGFLKLKFLPLVEFAKEDENDGRGMAFFQEVGKFRKLGPTYLLDINPIIDKLLHTNYDLRGEKGKKMLETWESIGAIPTVRERLNEVLKFTTAKHKEQ